MWKTPRPHARPRRVALAALALTVAGLATACGTSSAAGGPASKGSGAVLKLQDPGNAGPLAYAKREGLLEKRLKAVGATVEWGGSYASFTATVDAVHAGSVNILTGAISPAIGYLANSPDIRIFSVTDPVTDPAAPQTDGLVVRPDSPVRSVKDLVGKQVAVNKGGKGEYLLLLALEKAGVPVDQVKRVYLNPDQGAAAFATGKVDAWWAIVRAYPEAVAKGARVIVHGRDLDDKDLTIIAARKELLDRAPAAVRVYLEVLQELTEEARKTPEKFENVFLTQGPTAVTGARLALDIETAKHAIVPRYATKEDGAYITAVADLFRKYGVVTKPIDPADVLFDLKAATTSASPAASG
ncbi:sulfonate ABC transporter substrate-binding protein [Sphaerisporangium krabiense]|uniref:Sulfonate transport system substrate-binding protein n=1 Tax=Sphaerisporangium krabiense TaxID=763782 RepID=A0A7W9DS86_9ACTN|nr:NrtA/SsuA/CpmA family ABC transporter substrate-binding protein [Sphaerisporangium krabiense]MBB5628929.1 sulfonate transport system substrate-binding protein [Sphaerisporangium krabiense]GII60230.1 sulfonate ABC transporter substrate-binding protein [Sphaerisporangium krabiense]